LKQFVALGYIQPPSENQEKAAEIAMRELRYNLSRAYLDARNYSEALSILEELAKKWPEETRFQQYLAQCYLAIGRRAEAKSILERLIAAPPKKRPQPKKESPEGENVESPEAAPEPADTSPKPRPWVDLFMGIIHFEEGETDEALGRLLKAEDADPRLPDLHLRIGETYLRKKRTEDAERAFERALEIDGDSPEAHLGLALVRLRQRRNEDAAEQALIAVGLQHFLPLGHFYLGVALARLGHRQRAILAFETALSMAPGLLAAHRWLAALYNHPDGSREKAAGHRFLFAQLKKQREVGARVQ
jgi:tetratricopeptide (TPR) repeat protein